MTNDAVDFIRVRAPSLPPGIDAYVVLDVLKTAAPQLYAQVCDLVSAHYSATMAAQYRRVANNRNANASPH